MTTLLKPTLGGNGDAQAQGGEEYQIRDDGHGVGHGGDQNRWQRWGAHNDGAQGDTWRQWYDAGLHELSTRG